MKNKTATMICLAMLVIPGCSLINTGPGSGPRPPSDWENMVPVIQSRVKYITAFAFTMDKVKPHKPAVCQFANQLGSFLDSYDDHDASFEKLRDAVMQFVNNIDDPGVRDAVAILVDMALTEAFAYAWKHYKDFINQDPTKVALIIAGAVADGIRDACGMNLSTTRFHGFLVRAYEPSQDIFTKSFRGSCGT